MFARVDGRSGMAGARGEVLAADDKTDGPAELPDVAAVVEVMAARRDTDVSKDDNRINEHQIRDTNQDLEVRY